MRHPALALLAFLTACGGLPGRVQVDLSGIQTIDLASQQLMLEAVNQARAVGRNCKNPGGGTTPFPAAPALTLNSKLSLAAQYHAQDMAQQGFLDHRGSKGDLTADRIGAAHYPFKEAGENLAVVKTATPLALQQTIDASITSWLNSVEGHCHTLMDADFKELGVGYAERPNSTDRYYWVQVFGDPKN